MMPSYVPFCRRYRFSASSATGRLVTQTLSVVLCSLVPVRLPW